jgi:heme-degrading monooxygenase HmoA
MNRFRVAKGSEAALKQVWMSRDSHLDKVPGEGLRTPKTLDDMMPRRRPHRY